MQPSRQSGVQAIGQEGDEDMRFDPGLVLMEDRPDGEVALKVLEVFFDADEQQVQIPQLGGVVFGEIGAQEIAPLAPARPSQPIAVEVVGKGDALRRYRDADQAPRGWAWARAAPSFISNSSRLSAIIESCLR